VIVVRSAIRVDPRSAQVSIDSAGSDPIPHIRQGIPLHLRDCASTSTGRTSWSTRPAAITSPSPRPCRAREPSSAIPPMTLPLPRPTPTRGPSAPRLVCAKLSLRLKGGTRRGRFPSLTRHPRRRYPPGKHRQGRRQASGLALSRTGPHRLGMQPGARPGRALPGRLHLRRRPCLLAAP
jgi:hypothetical protein